MNVSRDASPLRPLLVGAVVGLIIGLVLGLTYAWAIKPVTYAGGAHPQELSDAYQKNYVGSVAEAYLNNRDLNLASTRLTAFAVQDKVRLLATIAAGFANQNRIPEADGVGDLAQALQSQENWPSDAVSAGLAAGGAPESFANKLGQVSQTAPTTDQGAPPDQAEPQPAQEEGGSFLRALLWVVLLLLIVAIVVILLLRIRPQRKRFSGAAATELAWDGVGPQPLRQWVGTYTFGQNNYDESFTVETSESDFLGECGMGILEGFASGSPDKKVAAFDVWLFDKTDIRTVSMPLMSKFAFEDEVLRGKLPPDATPILAVEGQTFDIETTALVVNATIEEVVYGEEQPEMSYFSKLKVSLTAKLKPDVDVSGYMPVPDEFS